MFACVNCNWLNATDAAAGEMSGAMQDFGLMVVSFEVRSFKSWNKEFEALLRSGYFEKAGVTATFYGERSIGLFSSAAHVVHTFPLSEEAKVRAAYESGPEFVHFIEKKMIAPANIATARLGFKLDEEDLEDIVLMATVTHATSSKEFWLEEVKHIDLPPCKLLAGTSDSEDIGMTVHLYSKALEKDTRKALAFPSLTEANLIPKAPDCLLSRLIYKKV